MVLVVFARTLRPDVDMDEYEEHSRRMDQLVNQIPGFLSIKSYQAEDGERIAIVRFENTAALDAWRNHPEHVRTQRRAREVFYESYWVKVCPTLRDYEWSSDGGWIEHQPELFSLES